MSSSNTLVHHVAAAFQNITEAPTNWPLIFSPLIVGLFIASYGKKCDRLVPLVTPVVALGSFVILSSTLYLTVIYLSTSFIDNSYATLYAMTSWQFHLGHPVYSDIHESAPYSMPYGPYGYIIVSLFLKAFGPSVFSSKLGPFLATFASFLLLYLAVRSVAGWRLTLVLTALTDALILAFYPLQYWPRPDPFMMLAICVGLWASTRREFWGPIILGLTIGFSANLKVTSVVYFLLPLAWAWRYYRPPVQWIGAGMVALVVFFLPFALPNISFVNYLQVVKMDSVIESRDFSALQSAQWIVILFLVGFCPLFIHRVPQDETIACLRRNKDLSYAFLLSMIPLAYICFKIDSHHLMPMVPVTSFLAACLFADASATPLLERKVDWVGFSMALSIALYMGLFTLYLAIFTTLRVYLPEEQLAREQIADLTQIYQVERPCVLLNASGSQPDAYDAFFYRAILVFNGMPTGIDATASMDYKAFGGREPDFPSVVKELKLRYRLPIVWICAKDTAPFLMTSYFAPRKQVFSDKFLTEFHRGFELSNTSSCFDIYTERFHNSEH